MIILPGDKFYNEEPATHEQILKVRFILRKLGAKPEHIQEFIEELGKREAAKWIEENKMAVAVKCVRCGTMTATANNSMKTCPPCLKRNLDYYFGKHHK